MRLRITSTDSRNFVVTDAATGDILLGVTRVVWNSDWVGQPKVELTLTDVAIDFTVEDTKVETYTRDGSKSGFGKLTDIGKLRWRKKDA
jgi:hypothetical protein